MSAHLFPYEFEHVLPENMVCEAATLLLDRFVADGGEPEGRDYQDFTGDAVKTWADDQILRAQAIGLLPAAPRWNLTANGDARVIFPLGYEAEAVLFRTLVL
ncbi:hypothetical protein SAMN04487843_1468 [Methylobacterium sp. ap11]|uniref:hypothetical protein n=1 Tax=Methylobacterium sp. ap11 TaxID=1761799 RepID=UPI0008AD185E|nr:hypothetical protein [Methylobacterium sp. ap11]SEP51222.1 hypothetical protein SAMN04487843_1468 [Methylobacterium sp. ap11]